MPTDDVQIKRIPAVRVAELTGLAAGFAPEAIGPLIGPLYDELCRRLDRAGVQPVGPALAYYQDTPDGQVQVHAAMPVNADRADVAGVAVVDLPEIDRAATIVHRGSMDEVMPTAQALASWIENNGYRSVGRIQP